MQNVSLEPGEDESLKIDAGYAKLYIGFGLRLASVRTIYSDGTFEWIKSELFVQCDSNDGASYRAYVP